MKDQSYRFGPLERSICDLLERSRGMTAQQIADGLDVPRDDRFCYAMNRLIHTETIIKVGTSRTRHVVYGLRKRFTPPGPTASVP